jgi:hypothetical protein
MIDAEPDPENVAVASRTASETTGYWGIVLREVLLDSKLKYFRTINVQWIRAWGLFSSCGNSWNQ